MQPVGEALAKCGFESASGDGGSFAPFETLAPVERVRDVVVFESVPDAVVAGCGLCAQRGGEFDCAGVGGKAVWGQQGI